MGELVPGGNQVLPEDRFQVRVSGPFDMSLLITDGSRRVTGDGDFVFFNQPSAPGARLHPDHLTVDTRRLRPGATHLTLAITASDPGIPLGRLPLPVMTVGGAGGAVLARFAPPPPRHERVLLLAEFYRHGSAWKVRALGQGYAEGLAGIARDFGVDVTDDGRPPHTGSPPRAGAPGRSGPSHRVTRSPGRMPGPAGRPGRPAVQPPSARRPQAPRQHGPTRPAAPHGARSDTAEAAMDHEAAPFMGLANADRSTAGVTPVTPDPRLVAAARAHTLAMAEAGRLGTVGRDGTSLYQRIAAAGYGYLSLAEHIVSGPRSAAELLEYLRREQGRQGELYESRHAHIGIGRAVGRQTRDVYWTVLWAVPFSPAGLTSLVSRVISLTNAERAGARLPPLAVDPLLGVAAQAHSEDMVARDFYSHTAPDGRQPWDRAAAAGCTHRGIGENIACGQRTAAEVLRGWMESPGHRANILKADFTHIGVGFATGSRAGTYWTQLFGMGR